jgi:hypothetical protein
MITMPRRSVTRFFIPMIDVLTLLFCMFLLMPVFRQNEALSQQEAAGRAETDDLKKEIAARRKELEDLQAAVVQLEKKPGEFVRKNVFYRTLYISPRDGTLSYLDPETGVLARLASEADARALIDRHRKEAGAKTIFYKFERLPDPAIKQPAFPTGKQMEDYLQRWFRDVATESYVTSAGEGR